MPELPEVETVRRSLKMHLEGRTIKGVGGEAVNLRRPLDPETLARALIGRCLVGFRRRGKFLLVDLDDGSVVLFHLGMTGRLQIAAPSEPRLPHNHLVLGLDDGRELRYADSRRFGLVDWLASGTEAVDPSLSRLGIEPFDPALREVLPPLLHKRRAPLKALLMDQRLVAGVGNIYAAEALWRSRIRPTRAGNRTSLARLAILARNVQGVLGEAIAQGGTTLRDYATPEGELGYFALKLEVYGRQGESCRCCGATLRAEVIGGRTTVWCVGCQT
ncbi:MAG: bifunctional DNA-formamidopyrimidine glycosylase/DNA-(apurinic or apyrimidinic site) lyase [Thermoanaerobaculales bacterium]